MFSLIIFDLDGTLLNTIADLAAATNYALAKYGFPTHAEEAYKSFVGDGIDKLFERALPGSKGSLENIELIRTVFLPYYNAHCMDKTRPFEGIKELLQDLQHSGVVLAVASNKYDKATKALVKHYFPEIHFSVVLGLHPGINPKPSPDIVYNILQLTGIAAQNTLYVGDSVVDMLTAEKAGIKACGVSWGYCPRSELTLCHPHFIADKPAQILKLIFP